MTKRIVLFLTHGAQALDVTGPAAVFAGANFELSEKPFYEVLIVSPGGGLIDTISGVGLWSKHMSTIDPNSVDTLLVVGHDRVSTQSLADNQAAQVWVTHATLHSRRWGSVCSGAFPLAAWGLLIGKWAATHWSATAELAHRYPETKVDENSLFVVDGDTWTSAGVTAGIDMSLAMVESDLGSDVASKVARHLVVYLRRPGSQSQFSAPLQHQCASTPAYADLLAWAALNLQEPLTIQALAERMGQSPRTFQRHFKKQVGRPPASVIEDLRLDRARAMIVQNVPLKLVSDQVGFSSASQLTSTFQRRYGVTPTVWKAMHSGNTEPTPDRKNAFEDPPTATSPEAVP